MRMAITVVAVLIGVLSVAAGAAKLALVPEEVRFLSQFGFNNALIMTFGAVQVVSGLLLFVPATRLYGSVVAAFAFGLSAILLLIDGNLAFAGISIVPVGLAAAVALHVYADKKPRSVSVEGE